MKLPLSQKLNEFVSSMKSPVLSIPSTSLSLALWFIPLGIKVSPASKVISTRNAPIFVGLQDSGCRCQNRAPQTSTPAAGAIWAPHCRPAGPKGRLNGYFSWLPNDWVLLSPLLSVKRSGLSTVEPFKALPGPERGNGTVLEPRRITRAVRRAGGVVLKEALSFSIPSPVNTETH